MAAGLLPRAACFGLPCPPLWRASTTLFARRQPRLHFLPLVPAKAGTQGPTKAFTYCSGFPLAREWAENGTAHRSKPRSSPRKRGPKEGSRPHEGPCALFWIPACAGMSGEWERAQTKPARPRESGDPRSTPRPYESSARALDSRLRGNERTRVLITFSEQMTRAFDLS